jgi:hypothetical protein
VTAAQCTEECDQGVADGCAPFSNCKGCCAAAAQVPGCDQEANDLYECFSSEASPCDADCQTQADAATNCIISYCFGGGGDIGSEPCSTLIGCQPQK